jgi:excinuclease ABC subunit A
VAIEQRASRGGRKSTVATLTEIYHFLRLLYVKLGIQHCPYDDTPIAPQSEESIAARLMRDYAGQRVSLLAPLVVARKGYYTDLAKWAARKGFAELRVDGEMLPTKRWPRLDRFKEHSIELPVTQGVVAAENEPALRTALARALEYGKGVVHVLGRTQRSRRACFSTKRRVARHATASYPDLDPRLFSFNSKHGWCPACYGTGSKLRGFDDEQTGEEIWWNEWYGDADEACPDCNGARLNREALAVRFRGPLDRRATQLALAMRRVRRRARFARA